MEDPGPLPDMPDLAAGWRAQGVTVTVGDRRIFVVEQGPRQAPVVVLLHGFPGSSFDWRRVVPLLSSAWRVLTFDFLGYGLSDKPQDVRYSLFDQADLTERLLAEHDVDRAVLVAHDMGDTVAAELLFRTNEGRGTVDWAGCILTNGSIFIDLAQLSAGQLALLDLPDEPLADPPGEAGLRAGLTASFPPDRPDPAELDAMVWLVRRDGGHQLLPRLIRYIEERRRHQPRWTSGLCEFRGPVVAGWGDLDPIAVPAMADRLGHLRQDNGHPVRIVHWPDLGHWPAVEAPEVVARLVADEAGTWW